MAFIDALNQPARVNPRLQQAAERYAKQGYGEWLLIDALTRLLHASDAVVFPMVIVDAKDGALHFYKKFGFTAFQDAPNKLFISIADVRASIEKIILS